MWKCANVISVEMKNVNKFFYLPG